MKGWIILGKICSKIKVFTCGINSVIYPKVYHVSLCNKSKGDIYQAFVFSNFKLLNVSQ